MQFSVRPLNLAAVVRAAVNVVLPAAQAKQVPIHLTLDEEDAVSVNGDPDRLQQALWNVLSNAVKFTSLAGQIDVRLAAVGREAQITVTDDGEGIAPEFLPHVFDRFRQADGGNSRKHGGLGIGLAIVRHVIELHGGSVRAESDGKGRGTTIAITLPMERAESGEMVLAQSCSGGLVEEPQRTNAAPEPVYLN
jgi:signal transduction histidine kinase